MSGSYVAPGTIEDALAALAVGARAVAGGTDLVVAARQGKATLPPDLVALHGIEALREQGATPDGGLRIGAGVSHAGIMESAAIASGWTALADASAIVGSPATRATGTLAGNVVNASPAADAVGPLVCFEAVAVVRSARGGERRVPVDGLATGPGRTGLRPDELVCAFELPALPAHAGSCYVRLEYRRQMEIAVVGATAVVVLDGGGRVAEARVAITALAPVIHRVPGAEAVLVGSDGSRDPLAAAGRAAADACRPISDARAPAAYRRAMAAVVTRRAIAGAMARAGGERVVVPASASLFGATA
jgi:CO/xanthine dehydrogenase FAD-binding subunit